MQISNVHMDDHSIVVGAKKTHTFGITDNAAFLHNLSDTLYSNKLLAAIREPLCNAWDAHIDAGIKDIPVAVTITPEYVEIKDFGKGISKEDFPTIYGVYGGSTKQTDNSQTGGFGLGCKAPFAYTDTFTVTSIHNGVKTIYSLNKISVAGGKPAISEIVSLPSNEPSGLTVQVPLKDSSCLSSDELFQVLTVISFALLGSDQSIHLKIKYKDIDFDKVLASTAVDFSDNAKYAIYENNQSVFNLSSDENEIMDVLTANKLAYSMAMQNHVLISYANVIYPLDVKELSDDAVSVIKMINATYCNNTIVDFNVSSGIFIIKAEPGTLAITPSRESLSYNNVTISNLEDLLINSIKPEVTTMSDKIVSMYCAAMSSVLDESAKVDMKIHTTLFDRNNCTLREEFTNRAKELFPEEITANYLLATHSFGLTPYVRKYSTYLTTNKYWDKSDDERFDVYSKYLNKIAKWTKKDIRYGKLMASLLSPLYKHNLVGSFYALNNIRKSEKIIDYLNSRRTVTGDKARIPKDEILDYIYPRSMFIIVSRTKSYIQQNLKNLSFPDHSAALVLTAKQYLNKDQIFADLRSVGYFIEDITEQELEYKEYLKETKSAASSVAGKAVDGTNLSIATSVKHSLEYVLPDICTISTVSRLEPIQVKPKYVWVVENGAIQTGYLNSRLALNRHAGSDCDNTIKFVLKDLAEGEDAAFVSTKARAEKIIEEFGIPTMSNYFKDKYVMPYISDDTKLIKLFSQLMCSSSTMGFSLLTNIRYSAITISNEHPVASLIYKKTQLDELMNRENTYSTIKSIDSNEDVVFGWLKDIAPNMVKYVFKPFFKEDLEGNVTIINIISLLLDPDDQEEVQKYIAENIKRLFANIKLLKEFDKMTSLFFMIREYLTWKEVSYWDSSRLARIFNTECSNNEFFNNSFTKLHLFRNKVITQFIEEIKNV